jgi:ferredoxin-type protein NapF
VSAHISRRQFLRGDLADRRAVLRPPWALSESEFVERCTRCGDCLTACPSGLIAAGSGGFPEVRFAHALCAFCTFCGDCARACRSGALAWSPDAAPWSLKARIGADCLTRRGVVCRSCGERCDSNAIRFVISRGGIARPQLDAAACTGCGACLAVCPVQAITLRAEGAPEEVCA